jgi:parallel beta-helix repeat protein
MGANMRISALLLLVCLCLLSAQASAQTKTLSVSSYGAVCNGTADDTAKFQAAADAAAASYASNRSPVTVTYSGNCVIAGSVRYGSGVHWQGNGGSITVPHGDASPTFFAVNADNVEWDHVDINFAISYGSSNPYASGIGWFASSDTSKHSHVKITNCHVSNSAWGIVVVYNDGTGGLSDVEIAHDTVTSPTTYKNWDGIHVAGAVSNVNIHDNTVTNRGDAALALTSEMTKGKTYTLSGATIENNTASQDLVGIDISGATNTLVSNNVVKATIPAPKATLQNPAFRQIYYFASPVGIHVTGNYFESGNNGGASATVKIDPMNYAGQHSWPPLNSTFEKNTIAGPNAPLYVRGASFTVDGNTFVTGGQFTVDYDGANGVATSDLVIGSNKWLASGTILIGANASLIQNVRLAAQTGAGKVTVINGGNTQKK